MSGVQLGFVGKFPANYDSQAQRLSLQKQGNFAPDDVDFAAAIRQGKHIEKRNLSTTPTLGAMLTQITAQQNAAISRVDLITHAGTGRVGLRGAVEVRKILGGYTHDVRFDDDTSGDLAKCPFLERTSLEAIPQDEQFKGLVAKARAKFAKNAELHVYACNAGLTEGAVTPLVQLVASTFGARTFMFKAEMGFRLKENSAWAFHLRFLVKGRDPATGAPNTEKTDEVDDYRDLDNFKSLIASASPGK